MTVQRLHRDYHALPPGTELEAREVVSYQGRMLTVQGRQHCRHGALFRDNATGRGWCMACGDVDLAATATPRRSSGASTHPHRYD